MLFILGQSETTESLMLTVVGMGVVFCALILLMIMVGVLHRVLAEKPAAPAPTSAAAPPPPTPPAESSDATDDQELIAVLAAAAATALGRSVQQIRVLRFTHASEQWASSGRHTLTTSHRPASQAPRSLRL